MFSLVVVIMTHGDKKGRLESSDGSFSIEKLWERFIGDKCKTLIGKPKIFFIQSCRGDKLDKGVNLFRSDVVDAQTSHKCTITLPSLADQLVMYATPEGYVAIRNTYDGSWLIQELCNQLETNTTDDLMSILTTTSRKVAIREAANTKLKGMKGVKQIPIIVSSLTKRIYFHNQ